MTEWPAKMRAIRFLAAGKIEIQQLEPRVPAPHEVLIKVRASGICHTDIEVLHGRYGTNAFPIVPGHEYAGEIAAVGNDISKFAIGDRVVVDPNIECGQCSSCLKGKTNLCDSLRAYGVTENGGFSEYSTVSASSLVPLGKLSYHVAALAEPMACVLNGIDAIGIGGVKSALIFGAGPIGLLMAFALKSKGIADITMVDINEERVDAAREFGFNGISALSYDLKSLERSLDLTIDATGVPKVAGGMINFASNGGKVLFFGVCPPNSTISISPFEIFRRQLTLAGAHSLNHNIREAIETIGIVGDKMEQLISHRVHIDEIPDFLLGKVGGPT